MATVPSILPMTSASAISADTPFSTTDTVASKPGTSITAISEDATISRRVAVISFATLTANKLLFDALNVKPCCSAKSSKAVATALAASRLSLSGTTSRRFSSPIVTLQNGCSAGTADKSTLEPEASGATMRAKVEMSPVGAYTLEGAATISASCDRVTTSPTTLLVTEIVPFATTKPPVNAGGRPIQSPVRPIVVSRVWFDISTRTLMPDTKDRMRDVNFWAGGEANPLLTRLACRACAILPAVVRLASSADPTKACSSRSISCAVQFAESVFSLPAAVISVKAAV